jgi:hypothetical protein
MTAGRMAETLALLVADRPVHSRRSAPVATAA